MTTFGEMATFSILIMPVYEHEKSFHPLVSSSVSLCSILHVHCMSLTLPFLDIYQDVFETTMNGIIFLISLLVCFSFVYLKLLATGILLDSPSITGYCQRS